MPSSRVEIGPTQIEQAAAAALAGTYTSADPLVFADVIEKGLSLRIQGGSASWILKWNGKTKSLGKLADIKTAKTAREKARVVRAMLKIGDDPSAYIASRHAGRDHRAATADIEARKAAEAGEWKWPDLVQRYIEDHVSQPKKKRYGTKPPSDSSIKDARRHLTLPPFDRLKTKLLRQIAADDIEAIRDAVMKENGGTSSRKVVNYSRAALSWAKRFHKGSSGLGGIPAWWTEVESLHVEQARTRLLTLEQIAKVLHIAETNQVLPKRLNNKAPSKAILAALWWIVLTAQRTSASMSILTSHLVDDPNAAGWKIVAFPAGSMKSKRFHALPIPPRVVMILDRAMAVRPSSQWVFPSERRGRRHSQASEESATSNPADDIHVYDSSVNLLIRRLRGLDEIGRARSTPDLLEGIPDFSPHDLRRSLATILSDMSIRGDAASAVLDHSSGVPGGVEFHQADVTRLVYNRSQRLELKREAMTAWTEAVFAACDEEWGLNRKSLLRHPTRNLPWYRRKELEVAREEAAAQAAADQAKAVTSRIPVKIDLSKLRALKDNDVEPDDFDEAG
ncbi:tyrosine-type recombinase/integrase [Microvirga lenta]|uniref:tyrosine-type recombinase/integrase n=1 Tax=Microvirga lenta TaxID=2881337 RepID=UPI001CFD4304|nr:integrase family protein [Microvirga lenta]MCB5173909.1 tyrosine-type recombinase/integrase [Microvirga lenta]